MIYNASTGWWFYTLIIIPAMRMLKRLNQTTNQPSTNSWLIHQYDWWHDPQTGVVSNFRTQWYPMRGNLQHIFPEKYSNYKFWASTILKPLRSGPGVAFNYKHALKWFVFEERLRWTKCYSGWWFQPTPLKNDGVNVSWDDHSQYMGKLKNYSKPPSSICMYPIHIKITESNQTTEPLVLCYTSGKLPSNLQVNSMSHELYLYSPQTIAIASGPFFVYYCSWEKLKPITNYSCVGYN